MKPGKKYRLPWFEPGVFVHIIGRKLDGTTVGEDDQGRTWYPVNDGNQWSRYKEKVHGKSIRND